MEVTGWGQYPKVTAEISSPSAVEDIKEILHGQKETIPFTPKLLIGGSEEADIVFKEFHLKDIHCILKSQNDL